MPDLWTSDAAAEWRRALARYDRVIAEQNVSGLEELDRWYASELPAAITGREPPHVVHEELVRLTKWKMARGVWRARNLALVNGNPPEEVEDVSRTALSAVPDPTEPIKQLARLAGVGPATASAVLAAAAPDLYPFLDELVAEQVPGLGKTAFTLGYYRRYAEALRAKAEELGDDWTPVLVERALWAHAGGKAGVPGWRPSGARP